MFFFFCKNYNFLSKIISINEKPNSNCYITNFKYLRKNLSQFIYEIRNNGKFEGKILILTSIFTPTFLFASVLKDRNVQVIRFKTIKLTRTTNRILKNLNTGKENRHNTKKFQWHKIHLFDKRLKNGNTSFI